MAHNPNFRTVVLNTRQIEAVRLIQERERQKSPVNAAPTISAIVRGLLDNALNQMERA
jgi:hypothetical protein